MGSCFCKCLPLKNSFFSKFLASRNSDVEFIHLVEDNASNAQQKDKGLGKSFITRLLFKRNKKKLHLVEGILKNNLGAYSRLNESQCLSRNTLSQECNTLLEGGIQLECLDARALMAHVQTGTSTPASLDLEWEHESLPVLTPLNCEPSTSSWSMIAVADSPAGASDSSQGTAQAQQDWSRVSSLNSLEWDSVHDSLKVTGHNSPISEMDTDTQALLNEIERLTNQTLQETGRDLDLIS